MKDFDWQTEEDGAWEEEEWQPQEKSKPTRSLIGWRFLSVVLILLLAAAGTVYWRWQERLEAVTSSVEADLLSTHNLLGQAVVSGDRDLFAPLMSGKDMGWTQSQEELAVNDLFFDRRMLGLHWEEAGEPFTPLTLEDESLTAIEIAPQMDAAEIRYRLRYQDALSGESVELEQTAVYRRGETRWLFAPPLPEFWGEWATMEGEYLTGIFPLRDEELAVRLLIDLDLIIAETCRHLTTGHRLYPPINSCDPDLNLLLRFESDPESLLQSNDPTNLYTQYPRFNAPAPTLVGYPLDESGYQAVFSGYARQVVSGVIAAHLDYDCCAHASFFQQVMTVQLAELGLAPPPPAPDPAELLGMNLHPDRLYLHWTATDFSAAGAANPDSTLLLAAFVQFLLDYYHGLTPLELLQRTVETDSFNRMWVQLLADYGESPRSFNAEDIIAESWWFYTYDAWLNKSAAQPLPFPNQDLEMTCATVGSEPDQNQSTLYRHALGSETWIEEFTTSAYLFMNPFPDDEAILLQAIGYEEERWYSQVWQRGMITDLAENDSTLSISLGEIDPSGRYILMYVGDSEADAPDMRLVDRERCTEDDCAGEPLNSTPIWSPSGEYTLLTGDRFFDNALLFSDQRVIMFGASNRQPYALQLGDRLGQPIVDDIGVGQAPFWLDETHFGYIRYGEATASGPVEELVISDVRGREEFVLVSNIDLKEEVFGELSPLPLSIGYAQVNPEEENQLAVMAYSRDQGYLILLDRVSGDAELRLEFGIQQGHSFGFSGDGRFLTITGVPAEIALPSQPRSSLEAFQVHDIMANETRTFVNDSSGFIPAYRFDWSENGEWLVMVMNRRALGLYAPEYDYFTLLPHDLGDCTSIAWVNTP